MAAIECAEGIVRVANAEMVRALRVVTVQRGVDPRRYALLAFGGAGGLHAARIAEELGITHIVCPRASGVLAALGLVVSPRRRDVQRSVFLSGDELTADRVAELVAELGEQAREELHEPEAELRAVYELRYRGQAFELAVGGSLTPEPEDLRGGFEALHEERYGYRDSDQELELVTLRVSATMPGADVSLQDATGELDARARAGRSWTGRSSNWTSCAGRRSPGPRSPGPRWSSCRSRRCWCRRAGTARSTTRERSTVRRDGSG